eukprot:Polyplicarium_translucidae@DN3983_c0_g1_i1.p1
MSDLLESGVEAIAVEMLRGLHGSSPLTNIVEMNEGRETNEALLDVHRLQVFFEGFDWGAAKKIHEATNRVADRGLEQSWGGACTTGIQAFLVPPSAKDLRHPTRFFWSKMWYGEGPDGEVGSFLAVAEDGRFLYGTGGVRGFPEVVSNLFCIQHVDSGGESLQEEQIRQGDRTPAMMAAYFREVLTGAVWDYNRHLGMRFDPLG